MSNNLDSDQAPWYVAKMFVKLDKRLQKWTKEPVYDRANRMALSTSEDLDHPENQPHMASISLL